MRSVEPEFCWNYLHLLSLIRERTAPVRTHLDDNRAIFFSFSFFSLLRSLRSSNLITFAFSSHIKAIIMIIRLIASLYGSCESVTHTTHRMLCFEVTGAITRFTLFFSCFGCYFFPCDIYVLCAYEQILYSCSAVPSTPIPLLPPLPFVWNLRMCTLSVPLFSDKRKPRETGAEPGTEAAGWDRQDGRKEETVREKLIREKKRELENKMKKWRH